MANLRKGNNILWPNDRVPYEIHQGDFPSGGGARLKIEWAIDHWNSRCRVKFVPHVRGLRQNWVRFVSHDTACSSAVGRQRFVNPFGDPPPQEIRCQLGTSGFLRGNVLHEMGHAVGLFHEHQRPDRDEYVTVTSSDSVNYGKKSDSEVIELTPYDYLSIMHYGTSSRLSVPGRIPVGQRDRLSYLDIYAIERRYENGGGDHWLISNLHIH